MNILHLEFIHMNFRPKLPKIEQLRHVVHSRATTVQLRSIAAVLCQHKKQYVSYGIPVEW